MNLFEIYKPVKKDLAEVEKELGRSLRTADRFVSQVGRHVLSGAGKRLRPALLLLSTQAVSPNHSTIQPSNDSIIQLAVAIELIHTATLVHDDVIDEAVLRRNKVTLNRKWGNDISILFGDYLHSNAFGILSGLKMPRILSRLSSVIKAMCEGEMRQLRMCFNPHLTEREYLSIVHQKTASLFSFSSESGARLAGASSREIEALSSYGLNFGIAYQIIDDCLDLVGEEEKAGKSLGSDIREGKLTLPAIHLLNSVSKNVKKEAIALLTKDNNRHRLREMTTAKGSIDYALKKARAYIEKAKEKIAELKESPPKESLLALADYVVARI